MDFGLLPPEINSARMYAGPGPGPMLAAAASWDALAAELHSTAASYGSLISGLIVGWQGPSALAMAAAAAPYTAWMSATAAQAEQTANQATMAVAAYETAFAATVPPPVIAANRAQLMTLVATNFFGQNTAAIMATEVQYAEMWAQDAAAMYGYAGASATAAQVAPFNPPPQTTNSNVAGQSAAVAQATATAAGAHAQTVPQLMSTTPQALQSLAAPAAVAAAPTPAQVFSDFTLGPFSPLSLYSTPGISYLFGVQNYLVPQNYANLSSALQRVARDENKLGRHLVGPETGMRLAAAPAGGASAGLGRAEMVGRLSVPPGWASAAPVIRSMAAVLPPEAALSAAPAALAADGPGSVFGSMALSGLAGRAMVGTGSGVTGSVGAYGKALGEATTATIIVIPADT